VPWPYTLTHAQSKQIVPHPEYEARHDARVRKGLNKQVAAFLRVRRGDQTYASFGRKVGLSPSTLFRLENGEQSITIQKLEQVLARLRCTVRDVFPPEG
jgi:transcriptional regulator with XRE-family HTH domain